MSECHQNAIMLKTGCLSEQFSYKALARSGSRFWPIGVDWTAEYDPPSGPKVVRRRKILNQGRGTFVYGMVMLLLAMQGEAF